MIVESRTASTTAIERHRERAMAERIGEQVSSRRPPQGDARNRVGPARRKPRGLSRRSRPSPRGCLPVAQSTRATPVRRPRGRGVAQITVRHSPAAAAIRVHHEHVGGLCHFVAAVDGRGDLLPVRRQCRGGDRHLIVGDARGFGVRQRRPPQVTQGRSWKKSSVRPSAERCGPRSGPPPFVTWTARPPAADGPRVGVPAAVRGEEDRVWDRPAHVIDILAIVSKRALGAGAEVA